MCCVLEDILFADKGLQNYYTSSALNPFYAIALRYEALRYNTY